MLSLTIEHFVDEAGRIRGTFSIKEEKRGKRNVVTINESIWDTLVLYLTKYQTIQNHPTHFVFFSTHRADNNYSQPLTRERAWQLVSEMYHAVGLSGNYGTHTLRKTRGYHAHKNGIPMEITMAKLNHTCFAFSKRYLGITDDELSHAVEGLNL